MRAVLLNGFWEAFLPVWDGTVYDVVDTTTKVAMVVIPVFILVHCGQALIKFMNGRSDLLESMEKLLICVFLFFLLTAYAPITKGTSAILLKISSFIQNAHHVSNESISEKIARGNLAQYNSRAVQELTEELGEAPNQEQIDERVHELIQPSFWDNINPFNIKAFILSAITDGITGAIRFLFEGLAHILIGVLVVVGPLAIMLQCAPWIGEGLFKHWFTSFISLHCWLITMSVIDALIDGYLVAYQAMVSHDTVTIEAVVGNYSNEVMTVMFIVLYLMVPKITSYWVKGDGGGMVTAFLGAASSVVALAASGGSAGATGILGMAGGGAAGSAQSTAALQQLTKDMGSLSKQMGKFTENLSKDN